MSSAHFFRDYWSYYIELESEFMNTIKYVELRADNYKTYSIEYLKLFQAICSEIDIIGKYMACSFNSEFKVNNKTNIKNWGYEIQQFLPDIQSRVVGLKEQRYELAPFRNWKYIIKTNKKGQQQISLDERCQSLFWWKDYNSVKHARMTCDDSGVLNYSRANLKNVVYSLSALYLLERLYIEKQYNMATFPKKSLLSPIESRLFFLLPDLKDKIDT